MRWCAWRRRAARVARVGAIVVCAACGIGGFWAATAQAVILPCPSTPPTYTGTDPVVAELRALRTDFASYCSQLVGVSPGGGFTEGLHWWLGANGTLHADLGGSGTLHGDLNTLHSDLGSSGVLDTDLAALRADIGTHAVNTTVHADLVKLDADLTTHSPVSGTVDLGSSTLASQDAASSQLDGDLWIICGAIVGCFVMGEVLRRIWP